MTFAERYEDLCRGHNVPPYSQATGDLFDISKATASKWKELNAIPKGKTIKLIADYFHVSSDYLLCRTDDPTDYTTQIPDFTKSQLDLIALFNQLTEDNQADAMRYMEFLQSKQPAKQEDRLSA